MLEIRLVGTNPTQTLYEMCLLSSMLIVAKVSSTIKEMGK